MISWCYRIFEKRQKPDVFITTTCNPNWPEIKKLLKDYPYRTNTFDIIMFLSFILSKVLITFQKAWLCLWDI